MLYTDPNLKKVRNKKLQSQTWFNAKKSGGKFIKTQLLRRAKNFSVKKSQGYSDEAGNANCIMYAQWTLHETKVKYLKQEWEAIQLLS